LRFCCSRRKIWGCLFKTKALMRIFGSNENVIRTWR
jgi:hypothetical protein